MKELTETEKLELLERYKIQVMFLSQFACSEDLPATEKKADDLIRHIDRVIFHRTRRKQKEYMTWPDGAVIKRSEYCDVQHAYMGQDFSFAALSDLTPDQLIEIDEAPEDMPLVVANEWWRK